MKGRVGVAIGKGAEDNRGSQDVRGARAGVFMGDGTTQAKALRGASPASPL